MGDWSKRMGRTSDFQRGKVGTKAVDCVVILGLCGRAEKVVKGTRGLWLMMW